MNEEKCLITLELVKGKHQKLQKWQEKVLAFSVFKYDMLQVCYQYNTIHNKSVLAVTEIITAYKKQEITI